jgi:hypothetical protein
MTYAILVADLSLCFCAVQMQGRSQHYHGCNFNTMVKIIISYDMQDGQEEACQEYLANKVAPLLARKGFSLNDVWFTMWGDSPQILGGGEVPSLDVARSIFLSSEWSEIEDELEPMTQNFQVRVLRGEDE